MRTTIALALSAAVASGVAASEFRRDPKVISCGPPTLRAGQDLVVKLGKAHGRELAIRRNADSALFFLVQSGPERGDTQIMSSEEFVRASRVTISTGIVAKPQAGVVSFVEQPIFTLEGTYDVLVSEVLESERGGYRCTVRFYKPAE